MQRIPKRAPAACILAVALSVPSVAADLSADGQKVVDYLLEDWSKRMHSTSIPQAMQNLGMPSDEDLRLEIAEHFRQNPKPAGNIRAWGANNYLLSDQEKRIAKYLINTFNADQRLPGLEAVAKALSIPSDQLGHRLGFMARDGFLVEEADSELGYKLTEKYMRWGGPLRFNYHTITIGEEHPFGVW